METSQFYFKKNQITHNLTDKIIRNCCLLVIYAIMSKALTNDAPNIFYLVSRNGKRQTVEAFSFRRVFGFLPKRHFLFSNWFFLKQIVLCRDWKQDIKRLTAVIFCWILNCGWQIIIQNMTKLNNFFNWPVKISPNTDGKLLRK